MDPVVYMTLAAAALQFMEFGLEALSLCRQIRDDYQGATQINKRLETKSSELGILAKELRTGISSTAEAGRRIAKIATDCQHSADELQDLLLKVRAAGRSNLGNTIKTMFRTMKEKRTIEKLEHELRERRALLDSAIVQDTRHRIDRAAVVQSQQYLSLSDSARTLMKTLVAQQITQSSQNAETIARISKLDRKADEHQVEIQHGIHNLRCEIHHGCTDLKTSDTKESLLRSLFYPEYDSRRQTVKAPWQTTFDWVFDHEKAAEQRRAVEKIEKPLGWSDFSHWLEHGKSIYWISGKLGSGKSTLMAYIVNDQRTRDLLQAWARPQSLHILTFFFWRSGSELQRSMLGLLRSLMYQLLESVPDLAEKLLQQRPLPAGRIPAWTDAKLQTEMNAALIMAPDQNFCIFVDGLDEFLGEYNELLDTISAFQGFPNVKFCVSSRPEKVISSRLFGSERLLMEQLNYSDILRFATERLAPHKLEWNFPHTIADRAEGVFYWAALVVQSIIRGIQSSDEEETLRKRLNLLPTEMGALLQTLLEQIDHAHKESLGFFLCFMEVQVRPNVLALALAISKTEVVSYDELWSSCERLRKQVNSQSCGMLEVGLPSIETEIVPAGTSSEPADCTSFRLSSLLPTDTEQNAVALVRRRTKTSQKCGTNCVVYRWSFYEKLQVRWVHRSARDFIFAGAESDNIRALQLPSIVDVTQSHWEGRLRYAKAVPYHVDGMNDLLETDNSTPSEAAVDLIKFVGQADYMPVKNTVQTLECLRQIIPRFDKDEVETPIATLWASCLESGLWKYVLPRVNGIAAENGVVPQVQMLSELLSSFFIGFQSLKLTVPGKESIANVTQVTDADLRRLADAMETLAALLQILLERVHDCTDRSHSSRICTRPCFLGSISYPHPLLGVASWKPASGQLAEIGQEEHVVHALARAWYSWYHLFRTFTNTLLGAEVSKSVENTIALFESILDVWEVRFGPLEDPYVPRIARSRVMLQTPADTRCLNAALRTPTKSKSKIRPTFRLAFQCHPKGLTDTFRGHKSVSMEQASFVATIELDDAIYAMFQEHDGTEVRSLLSQDHIRKAIIKQIMQNKDMSMTAWQQLYARAATKTEYKRREPSREELDQY